MGDLKYLLPILVAVILVWITYLVINFVATIIKTKKKDDTMVCGLNMQGKIFYAIIIVIYLVMLVYCIYYMITHLLSGDVECIFTIKYLNDLFFCFLFNDSMDYFLWTKTSFNWSCFI